jgi:hypothetical protein
VSRFVFFGFSHSNIIAKPWLDAGIQAVIADERHPAGVSIDGLLTRIGIDLMESEPVLKVIEDLKLGRCLLSGFFPPCTHLAASGARWWKTKGLRALQQSVSCFATSKEAAEALSAPFFIENPVGAMSSHWRKPDFTFDPCDYTWHCPSDNYTKKTCLWVGNGFVMPPRKVADGLGPPDSRIHFAPESKGRASLRSLTPLGFAKAVFESNFEETKGEPQ